MKTIAFSQRVLRAPGSGGAWTPDRPPGPPDALLPRRRTGRRRSLRLDRRLSRPYHLKAALIVNPLGATVVTWVTNWPRHCTHTLSLTHSPPVSALRAARLAFPLPPDPDSTRPLPDEETRTMVGAPA